MQLTDRLVQAPDVVTREVAGEVVLMDLASGTYFGLNEVGGKVWRWLGDPSSLDEISTKLMEAYTIKSAEAQADVLALAQDLLAHGLLNQAE